MILATEEEAEQEHYRTIETESTQECNTKVSKSLELESEAGTSILMTNDQHSMIIIRYFSGENIFDKFNLDHVMIVKCCTLCPIVINIKKH